MIESIRSNIITDKDRGYDKECKKKISNEKTL